MPSRSIRNSEQTAYLTPVLTIMPGRKKIVIAESKVFRVQVLNALFFPESKRNDLRRVATTTTRGAIFKEKSRFEINNDTMSVCNG